MNYQQGDDVHQAHDGKTEYLSRPPTTPQQPPCSGTASPTSSALAGSTSFASHLPTACTTGFATLLLTSEPRSEIWFSGAGMVATMWVTIAGTSSRLRST